jgi:hypothetical protein
MTLLPPPAAPSLRTVPAGPGAPRQMREHEETDVEPSVPPIDRPRLRRWPVVAMILAAAGLLWLRTAGCDAACEAARAAAMTEKPRPLAVRPPRPGIQHNAPVRTRYVEPEAVEGH